MPTDIVADRLAIRDLVHAYAQGLDGRDLETVAELFTVDATYVTYATPGAEEPTVRRRGRADIATGISAVRRYRSTTHAIANHLATVEGDRAAGETRCVAYHVTGDQQAERLLVWHLRYLDRYVRGPEGWRISERVLRVDVVTEQPLRAG